MKCNYVPKELFYILFVLAFCCLQTPRVTDLKLSLQSKSFDERFRHMIEPLEPRHSLVLGTRINGHDWMRLFLHNVINLLIEERASRGWPGAYSCKWLADLCLCGIWHLLTHSDLPVQNVSGDVAGRHGVDTGQKTRWDGWFQVSEFKGHWVCFLRSSWRENKIVSLGQMKVPCDTYFHVVSFWAQGTA